MQCFTHTSEETLKGCSDRRKSSQEKQIKIDMFSFRFRPNGPLDFNIYKRVFNAVK